MDSRDVDKIWALLGKCRLGDIHLQDKSLKVAWALVLEPYAYEDVKQAVVAHFRTSKFWPDIGEVTQYLPDVPTPNELRKQARQAERLRKALRATQRALENSAEYGS